MNSIGSEDKTILKFLESLIVSDTSDSIRATAIEILINKYLKEGENILKWAIKHESSVKCIIRILASLEQKSSQTSHNLIRYLESELDKEYLKRYKDLAPRDALILEMISMKARQTRCPPKEEYSIEFKLKNGRVIGLLLQENFHNIDSSILQLFPSLQMLTLLNCKPGDYSGLINLRYLKISMLETIWLKSIKDIKGLKTLINLEFLDLSNNRISKIEVLDFFVNLKELNLSWNPIEEIENLNNLKGLEILKLFNTRISEIKGLESLSNLRDLDLSLDEKYRTGITEIKGIKDLTKLEKLYLAYNEIPEIKALDNLLNLKDLDLFGNNITEIKGLEHLVNLKSLNLGKNQIADIKGLNSLKNLKTLILSENFITEIKGLSNLKKLRYLNLDSNFIDTDSLDLNQCIKELNDLRTFKCDRQDNAINLKNKIIKRKNSRIKQRNNIEDFDDWVSFKGF